MIVEICANSFESALAAQNGGADRIELCTQLAVGGLTPSHQLIKKVISELSIPVHILIRPRKGNFCYSKEELNIMKNDIEFCKNIGCSGVVSGVLQPDLTINLIATKELIEAANGIDFTFHRAFDCVKDSLISLENLIDLKVKRVLSSGLKPSAIEGISSLSEMNKIANQQIEIMPGSGINLDNVLQFKNKGFTSIHLSATQQPEKKSASFFEGGTEGVSDEKTIRKIMSLVS
ncbi:MAG: copper homeostasis protein CutC [Flavobacteriaceae bacterium]|nr:copper homeostasis protein CutC [Flavobacteriaceae bacterium]